MAKTSLKVKQSRPDNSELRVLLGEIYGELGQKQKARHEYEEAIHLAPTRADLRERLRKLTCDDTHPIKTPQP